MARILVVEDDPDQLEMRKLILEHAGYEVATAQNAAEALDRLPGCQVVVMDLRLPTPEDGLRLIQAASGSAKIIVLSGDAETALPVDEFLTKPCSSKKAARNHRAILHAADLVVRRPAALERSRSRKLPRSSRSWICAPSGPIGPRKATKPRSRRWWWTESRNNR